MVFLKMEKYFWSNSAAGVSDLILGEEAKLGLDNAIMQAINRTKYPEKNFMSATDDDR